MYRTTSSIVRARKRKNTAVELSQLLSLYLVLPDFLLSIAPCLSILVMVARPYPPFSLSLPLTHSVRGLSYSTVGKSGLNGNRKIRFPDPVNGARRLLPFLLSLRFTSVLLASSLSSPFSLPPPILGDPWRPRRNAGFFHFDSNRFEPRLFTYRWRQIGRRRA